MDVVPCRIHAAGATAAARASVLPRRGIAGERRRAASAPVVAAAFHPALATMGVLLAVLGYVLGTYVGILDALVLQQIAQLYVGEMRRGDLRHEMLAMPGR